MDGPSVGVSAKNFLIPGVAIVILLGYLLHEMMYGDWSDVFVIFQAGVMCLIPYLLARKFEVITPSVLHVGLVCFFIATLVLGEVNSFYRDYWWWDVMLHGVAGAGMTLIGFIVLILLFKKRTVAECAATAGFFAFSFALGLSVLWEMYEYTFDLLFAPEMPMQAGNTDTMTDFIIAAIGGLIVVVPAYLYLKYHYQNIVGDIIEEGKVENGGM